jgi:hypothetical protein
MLGIPPVGFCLLVHILHRVKTDIARDELLDRENATTKGENP